MLLLLLLRLLKRCSDIRAVIVVWAHRVRRKYLLLRLLWCWLLKRIRRKTVFRDKIKWAILLNLGKLLLLLLLLELHLLPLLIFLENPKGINWISFISLLKHHATGNVVIAASWHIKQTQTRWLRFLLLILLVFFSFNFALY